jgi:hypothetical protein
MGAGSTIQNQVGSWPGVVVRPHRFGGVEYLLGRTELGHVHGDRLADLPFPRRIRDDLIASNRAVPHHVLPHTGWVSRRMTSDADVVDVIDLFRLNYDRLIGRRRRTAAHDRGGEDVGR